MTKRRGLSRDILGIFGTRAIWSAMGLVSGVILARWLGPHDRGILALILLLPSTVVTLTKLGLSQANVYAINREKQPITQVTSNSVAFGLASGVLAGIIVWLLRDNLLATVLRDVPDWALLLALIRVPLLLLDNYLYGVLQATGQFGIYNTRLILSEVLRLILVVLFLVVLHQRLFAAVAIYTLVSTVNVGWLMITMRREIPYSLSVDMKLMLSQLAFGAKSYIQVATAHLLLRIDIYMVSYFLTPSHTAFYALALHFTELALEIPQAVGLVLYPRLASIPEEEVHVMTAQACRRTLLVTAPVAFALGVLGPYVITLWYGKPYTPAGAPLPWAAVGVAAMSIFVIISRDFTSRGRQRVNIASGLLALAGNVVLNSIMIPTIGIVGAAMATAISYSAACVVLIVFFLYESHLPLHSVLVPTKEDLLYFSNYGRRLWDRLLAMSGKRKEKRGQVEG